MTDPRFNKGIQDIKKLSMTAAEKRGIFERITAGSVPARASSVAVKSPWSIFSFNSWVMQHRTLSINFAAILAVILTGGGVASAAMNALPGDSLYNVKVNVVEPIRVALATTPVAQAEIQAQLTDTRLNEAETLAAQGRLDDSKKTQIAALIDTHTQALSQALDVVSQDSPQEADAISNSFEASAQAHVLALQDLTGESAVSAQAPEVPTAISQASEAPKTVTMSAAFAPAVSVPTPSASSVPASNARPMMMSAMMAATTSSEATATSVSAPQVPVAKMAATMKMAAVPAAVSVEAATSSDSIIRAIDSSINLLRLRQRIHARTASSTDLMATSSINVKVNGKSIDIPNVNGATSIQVTATSSSANNGSVNVEVQTNGGAPVHTVIQNGNGTSVQIEQTMNANSSVKVGI